MGGNFENLYRIHIEAALGASQTLILIDESIILLTLVFQKIRTNRIIVSSIRTEVLLAPSEPFICIYYIQIFKIYANM